jgi:hypothetical protein
LKSRFEGSTGFEGIGRDLDLDLKSKFKGNAGFEAIGIGI